MSNFVLANIMQLFSNAFEFTSNGIKKRHTTIRLQFFARVFDGITDFLLLGYSGLIVDITGAIRNFLNLHDQLTPRRQVLLVIATIVLIPIFNNRGVIGLLPLVSVVFFTCSSRIKDPFTFKMINAIDFLPWVIYDFTIQSYVSMVGDIISILLCFSAAVRIKRREDRAEKRRLRTQELAREARRIKKERARRQARLERIAAKLNRVPAKNRVKSQKNLAKPKQTVRRGANSPPESRTKPPRRSAKAGSRSAPARKIPTHRLSAKRA